MSGFGHMLLNFLQNTDLGCVQCTMLVRTCVNAYLLFYRDTQGKLCEARRKQVSCMIWCSKIPRYQNQNYCMYCCTTCTDCNTRYKTGHTAEQRESKEIVEESKNSSHRYCGLLDMERSIWRMKYGFYRCETTLLSVSPKQIGA